MKTATSTVVWSPKGGVGKTRWIANQLHRDAKNRIAFDLDSQADLTILVSPLDPNIPTITDIIQPVFRSQPRLVDSIAVDMLHPTVGLVRGNMNLALAEHDIAFHANTKIMRDNVINIFPHIIHNINTLNKLKIEFDEALIDTSPAISYLNAILVMTADNWFIPLDSSNAGHTLKLIVSVMEKFWLPFHTENQKSTNAYYFYKNTMPTIIGGSILPVNGNPDVEKNQQVWSEFLDKMLALGFTVTGDNLTFIKLR